jgi:hypothetical protein
MEPTSSSSLLDRAYQLALLQMGQRAYPGNIERHHMQDLQESTDKQRHQFNLVYLIEHGLMAGQVTVNPNNSVTIKCPRLTKDGVDFLQADGGLSAILGVTTIRLHRSDLERLIEERIQLQPDLSPADKTRFVDQLRSLPADATKQVTVELLTRGLDQLPNVLQYIRTFLG